MQQFFVSAVKDTSTNNCAVNFKQNWRHQCIACFSNSLATPAPVKTTSDKKDDIEENSEIQDNTEIIENEPFDSGNDTEDEIKRLELEKNLTLL